MHRILHCWGGWPFLPCFLGCSTPPSGKTAAASLAIIDEPWCRDELIAILQESDDQEATAECRSALLLTPDPEVHRVVEEWETRNPHEAELGQWISMREHSLRSCGAFVQYEMEKLHDRVLPMRGQPPPELSAETSRWWWPFGLGNGS